MFSVFMLDPLHGWIATHRLPFNDAVHYAKEYLKKDADSAVALVPDGEDPVSYLMAARHAWLLKQEKAATMRRAPRIFRAPLA